MQKLPGVAAGKGRTPQAGQLGSRSQHSLLLRSSAAPQWTHDIPPVCSNPAAFLATKQSYCPFLRGPDGLSSRLQGKMKSQGTPACSTSVFFRPPPLHCPLIPTLDSQILANGGESWCYRFYSPFYQLPLSTFSAGTASSAGEPSQAMSL